jgi:hypothetical protein
MIKTALTILLAFTLGAVNVAFAGGPKSSHPCYDVADCKTAASQEDFSACLETNKEEVAGSPVCTTFLNDKETYFKLMGMTSDAELFE